MILFLDIETYSEADLSKYGHVAYAKHATTEILVVAWALAEEPVKSFLPINGVPIELRYLLNFPDIKIVSHNAQFEHSVFKHVATKSPMNLPYLPIERFICTYAIAKTLNIPSSLAGLTSYLKLDQQKYAEGKKLINLFSYPNKDGKRTMMADMLDESARFIKYCVLDVEAMRQAYYALPIKVLSLIEQKTWELDNKINETGVPIDLKLVNACADLVTQYVERETITFINLFGFKPTQNSKLIAFLHTHGIEIENTQKETLEALTDLPEIAQLAIDMRLSINKASVKKFNVMRNASVDSRIYGCFNFAVASTGRWSSKIVQFQNLARPTIDDHKALEYSVYQGLENVEDTFDKPLVALSSLLRHVIKSNVGLNVVDFSSIEARVLAWLAGQEDVLRAYEQGIDIYKRTAGKLFNLHADKVSDKQRFLGKTAELALGYQGGANAFTRLAKGRNVEITEALAEKIKMDWREANDKIVQLWHDVERTGISVVKDGRTRSLGKFIFGKYKHWLYIKLPSDRTINYAEAKVVKAEAPWGDCIDKLTYYGQDPQTKQWRRIDTYGGKLVENLCQAVARDILRDAMLRLDKAGHTIVLHVHDEVVIEGDDDLERIENILTQPPYWAKGLPIDASVYFATNYKK